MRIYPTAVVALAGNVFDEGQVYVKQNASVRACDNDFANLYAWEPVSWEDSCVASAASRPASEGSLLFVLVWCWLRLWR